MDIDNCPLGLNHCNNCGFCQVCSECGIRKLLSDFYYRKDGNSYRKECKECKQKESKQYFKDHKEVKLNYSRKYHNDNKEIISKKRKYKYKNNINEVRDKTKLRENPNYFNCLNRDDNICHICKEKNEKLLVHHINSNRKDNDLDNLMTLCYRCHQMITWFNVLNIKKSKIGIGTLIEPFSNVDNSDIGNNCIVRKFSNIYNSKIGNNNKIGAFTEIGESKIGSNCKIEAYCFIPKGVEIEDNCFVGPHVCFTNDKYPPSDNWSKTLVKKGASIGANATILPGIIIGVNALVGAGSVVTKDVKANTTVVGNPARVINKCLIQKKLKN